MLLHHSCSHSTGNGIESSGISKLSEALKLNSSLSFINLGSNTRCFGSFSLNADWFGDSQLKEPIERNKELWNKIHDCIRTNDLELLMTLLSKHSINLNNFNRSTDGDTILHSAVKSNNMKTLQFVLQRISPSTKQRMLKLKNKHKQLPCDLVTVLWTPSVHSLFPLKLRQVVKAVLMLGAKRQDGTPYYPQTHFYKLPRDVLYEILQYAASTN
jgi:ankyrin repeat protein